MPKIIITRKKNWWIRTKILEVFLDGQRLGYLSKGEIREFDVSTGEHTLKAKMGWYGSRNFDFTLFNKETKAFTVAPRMIFLIYFPIFLLGFVLLNLYVHATYKISRTYTHIFPASIIIIVTVFQIIGRFRYLIIKEVI